MVAVVLLAYVPAIRAGYVWDDDAYVTGNTALRSLAGLKGIWFTPGTTPQYYPLVHTTFWLEYRLWGLHPMGFHLVNILIHSANALLFWWLLRWLRVPGALFAASVFALHPVCVESVAWVTERKNVLSLFFYLGALLAWVGFSGLVDRPEESGSNHLAARWRWYALSLLAFLAALLSKTVTCTLPASALVILWWKRGRIRRDDVLPLVPFFVLGLVLARLTVWMERVVVGASGEAWQLSFAERFLVAGRALWFYAAKLLVPSRLTFIYPRWELSSSALWQWLFPAAALAVMAAAIAAHRRIGRGIAAALLLFAGTLVPALGFFDVFPFRYSFVADHFQYHASLALIALGCAGAAGLAAKAGWNSATKRVAAAVLVVGLASLTSRQARAYASEEALWRDTLAKNPSAVMAHNNLAILLERRGQVDEAIEHYEALLRMNPEDAMGHYNLGNALARRGDSARADEEFSRAESLQDDALMQFHLGLARRKQGRTEEAKEHFAEAAAMKSNYVDPLNEWGTVLASEGDLEQAIAKFRQALAIRPDHGSTRVNLAIALARKGDSGKAEQEFREALRHDPDDAGAHMNYAVFLEAQGRINDASHELREALRLQPGMREAAARLQRLGQR